MHPRHDVERGAQMTQLIFPALFEVWRSLMHQDSCAIIAACALIGCAFSLVWKMTGIER